MKHLYDEIRTRFPEIVSPFFQDNHDLPYCLMSDIALWLKDLPDLKESTSIIQRIVSFQRWCENQPKGETASDDIWTIYIVGFFEKLFEDKNTQSLIPHLVSKEELISNSNYLRTWVGIEKYERALTLTQEAEQGATANP